MNDRLDPIFRRLRQVRFLSWCTPTEMWRIMKYGVSGLSGGFLQVFFLYVFADRFGMWYLHGVVLAFLASLVIVFLLQKYWTFKDFSKDRIHWQSLLYGTIAMGALVLNVALMYLLVDILHVWHLSAQFVVVLFVGMLTFLLNRRFTFQ